jgi:CRP-like cAMP-binding protein
MPNMDTCGLFEGLSAQSTSQTYRNGQAIYLQGDVADSMFRIEHGSVKLTVSSKSSKRPVVAILRAGDCFGEACLFGSPDRRGTATSIQRSTIGRISKKAVERLLSEPAFANLFMRHLALRIGRVEDDLLDQLVNCSEKRLARLLLQLSDFGKDTDQVLAEVDVDQGTLAQVVGTTRSRVSHFMNGFRKRGFIDYQGTLSSLRVHKSLLTFLQSSHLPA